MVLALMLTLFAMEIALAALTMVGFQEKKQWLKNRLYIRAGEIVLFLIALVLPQINLDFRFMMCFVVLVFRALIALFSYLRKAKKVTGTKSKAAAAFGAILGIMVIVFSLVPAFIFSDYQGLETSGPYAVNHVSAILVDESRVEHFETDGSKREVPIYFYYPNEENAAGNSYPLVFFSHGAFGYYESNFSTYAELASHGYVVISMDHPYHSFITEDTAGSTITVDPAFISEVMMCSYEDVSEEEKHRITKNWFDLRTADMNFVVETVKAAKEIAGFSGAWHIGSDEAAAEILDILAAVNTERIGLMGHSIGGAASVTVGRSRDDIDAVINLDGTMLGEHLGFENGKYIVYDGKYPVPLLEINSEMHYQDRTAQREAYVNVVVMNNAIDPTYTYFAGSGHMNFTDLPLLSPFLASMLGTGSMDETECVKTMNSVILMYFDHYLKGIGKLDIKASY